MIIKVTFIFTLIALQNIFLINPVLSAQKYIEVDKIVAIVETRSITKLELNKKKEKIIILAKPNLNWGTASSQKKILVKLKAKIDNNSLVLNEIIFLFFEIMKYIAKYNEMIINRNSKTL